MIPPEKIHESLKALIDEPSQHKEKECRDFIKYAVDLFVPYTGSTNILGDEEEYPGHTGPNDLIVFCERNCGGLIEKHAYIWEIKSPQAPVFIRDTNNRVKPSQKFVDAENQLLHYWEDCKTEQFREKFEVSSLECIHLGGILIGRRSSLVSGDYDESKSGRLYKTALNLRKRCLYKEVGIQVLVWDDVLDFIKPTAEITQTKTGHLEAITIANDRSSGILSSDDGI